MLASITAAALSACAALAPGLNTNQKTPSGEGAQANDPAARLISSVLPEQWHGPEVLRLASACISDLAPFRALAQDRVTLEVQASLPVSLSGKLDPERMGEATLGIAWDEGFDRAEFLEVARLVPSDATFLAYSRGPAGSIVQQLLMGRDPAREARWNKVVRAGVLASGFEDLTGLFGALDAALAPRVAFFARPCDYGHEEHGPRSDGQPVFAWMVFVWMNNKEVLQNVGVQFGQQGSAIGLRGDSDSSTGYFRNRLPGNLVAHEYWSTEIPGTGHIATAEMGDLMMISNHTALLEDVIRLVKAPDRSLAGHVGLLAALGNEFKEAKMALHVNLATGKEMIESMARARRDADAATPVKEKQATPWPSSFTEPPAASLTLLEFDEQQLSARVTSVPPSKER